ncbi:amino acid adenylation domain-containing protein [Nocardia huaxiensis]|uniref:Amino acid adenylation domain-containing protein n=1 Tax=Nocardia huaxiensis TaxID=2755382 RepID=A0A7D6ZBZ2_9NOCA|nr:amino acid adenylation domain-containing protein [Nocardia huaxiensis]
MTRPARVRPTRTRRPRIPTLPQLLSTAVEANPAGTALVLADAGDTLATLGYAELDVRSTRLARLLIDRGVGPEDLVAVGIRRSLESVIAVWAVAKTGAGFVPVDPNYPADRVAHMVSDSGAVLGLTVADTVADLPEDIEWLAVDTDETAARLAGYPADAITNAERVRPLRAEHPAYAIYTSGSTGKPKGVIVTHAGLAGFCEVQRERYRVTADSRTVHFATPSFDASILELLLAIGGAATMVVVSPTVYGGSDLAAVLKRERVTHAFITPAALASVDHTGLDELRVVITGGEACPPDLVQRWAADGRAFWNAYGPTEATVMTNMTELLPDRPVTIGAPIPGVTAYVLDEGLSRVPLGVAGELYVAGTHLARGYHGQAGLTASRFVANPFDTNGTRLYRTGDLVRWTVDGELEYLGRNDFQVKIRGFRIELGEIDAVLADHPALDLAVTVGHELASGATVLVSYVHATAGDSVDAAELTALAESRLPAHMVPTAIMVLDEIPLTPAGKLDRRALPEPVLQTTAYRAPETPQQQAIAEVVAEVLKAERVGLDDDFFALGVDSITSIQIVSRARARGVAFKPKDLFAARTVADLAEIAVAAEAVEAVEELATGPLVDLDDADMARLREQYPNLADVWPLTPLQSGMLFHALLAESSVDAYMTQFSVELGGDLDLDQLHSAAQIMLDRHVNLRAVFAEDAAGNPLQVVLDDVEVPWQYFDFSDRPAEEAAAEADRVHAEEMARHFDMRTAPLLRYSVIRVAGDRHRITVTSHHILIDGWSMPLLMQDMFTLYAAGEAAAQLPPVRSYRDYLAWLAARDHDASRAAWRTALAGITEPTPLAPVDRSREISSGIGEVEFTLDAAQTGALARVAADAGVTVNTIVQAAWGLLIGRSTDRDDVVFGATVSGRPPQLAGIETMVGLFLNAIPVRVQLSAADTLIGLLRHLQDEQAALLDHHFLGLGEIQEIAGVDGLFDSLIVFASFPVDGESLDAAAARTDGVGLLGTTAANGTHYPLTVMVMPDRGALRFTVKYLRDLFDDAAAETVAERYSGLLARFAAEPAARVTEIDALTAGERTALAAVNATEVAALLDDSTLLTLFDAQVARTPDAPAIIFGDTTLTYAELDARSQQLAHELILRGVGPESRVAIAMRRSIELVVAVYAVLRAGGAYVPVDPDHPAERNESVLAGSAPVCVLTRTAEKFDTDSGVPLFLVDALAAASDFAAAVPAPVHPDNTAYVIFTSGSTGKPKGVAITHRQMANQFRWAQRTYPHAQGDVVLHKTPITFDISTWELFWPLQTGAAVVIAEPDGHRDPAYIARMIDEHSVTAVHFVPSMLDAFLDDVRPGWQPSLRWVFAAGEALTADSATTFADVLTGTELINWYGPAEATVVTAHPAENTAGVAVPIGSPVANTRVHVLDRQLRPVPFGAAGELYVAGVQLARGYLGAPALTAERFVAHDGGERLYRTGDVVRWTGQPGAGAALEYLGRSDFQVKLRGQRIELGEIESVLAHHDAVHRAAVALVRSATGDQLVAYVVLEAGAEVTDTELLAHVRATLPSYMVPSAVVRLEAMPLNASGKLDRKALPVPEFQAREYRAPETATEKAVAEVFSAVLHRDPAAEARLVGADDDFFELGGNSLIATQVVARLGAALGVRVPVRALFEAPTVAELAAFLAQQGDSEVAPLRAMERPERIPLSYAQQRMWFLNRFDPESAVNNLPFAVRLSGPLDVDALRAAVGDLLERHELLRTVYPEIEGEGFQVVLPAANAVRPVAESGALTGGDESALPELVLADATEDEILAQVAEAALAGFDVTLAPPLRLRLLRISATEHVLIAVIHHIAGDGFSMGPLTRDLMTAYLRRAEGQAPQWSPLEVQYADFALWQREVLGSEDDPESLLARQIGYWRDELAGLPGQLDLPADRPRPAVASNRGATYAFEIDPHVHAALNQLAQRHDSTLFMVAHAAFAVLLARLSGTRDIAVGTPVAGRGEAALDDLIGMFVNTLVLRADVDPGESFSELLARVRRTDIAAFGHADVPFERLVEVLDPVRSAARHPLFQVMLTFQNLGQNTFELPGLAVSAVDLDVPLAKFDLQLTLAEQTLPDGTPQGLTALFTYATDLFDEATVHGFAERFRRVLVAVAAHSDEPVGDYDLLAVDELEHVVTDWNATAVDVTAGLPEGAAADLISLFEARAEATPYATALVYEDESGRHELSYSEFAARVHRLARRLTIAGVRPESLVALGIRRSVDLVTAMYAVLAAGGAYVPLDPDQPAERVAHVLGTADPVCVLTTSRDGFDAPGHTVLVVDELELSGFDPAPLTDAERRAPLHGSNTAYVIFTSGSTGRPKGVAVPHNAVVNQIRWITSEYALDAQDVVLFKTPATFDVSVWELFGPLAVGGRMVIATPDGHRDPQYLADVIATERVSLTSFVPSMLSVFAGSADPAAITSLRALLVAGEAFSADAVAAARRLGDIALHNLYGPTEFTVHATAAPVPADTAGAAPIGLPVWNSQAYVLDSRLHPVAPGMAGELYLAGAQLARCYVGRADLTSDRFVANPFGRGERMYRTGDLVTRTADGSIVYLGRTDFQVKLRGQRIELGEIESALTAHRSVAQAVVVVHSGDLGDQLVGYVVPAPGTPRMTGATAPAPGQVDVAELRAHLADRLPSYMVPAGLVVLDAMPLNANGKLDRKALPAPEFEAREFRAPATGAELLVAEIFGEVLGLGQPVGADDDFFALGGNSLVATQVVARLAAALDTRVPVRLLFDAPTVAALAAELAGAGGGGRLPALVAGERPDRIPLSPAQQRMWFLNRFDSGSAAYNIPVAVRLTGELNVDALRAAVADVVARHEILRTVYPETETGPVQVVLSAEQAGIDLEYRTVTPEEITGAVLEIASHSFDVTSEVPLRAALFRIDDAAAPGEAAAAEYVVAMVVHHISGDGSSVAPLTRDLMTAYAARSFGVAPGWEPLPVQYADYAIWQRALLGSEDDPESLAAKQIAYWRTALADLPDQLELPFDRPRPAMQSVHGGKVAVNIGAEAHGALAELARAEGATLFMVVHTALAVLLARLSGTEDIAIGTPIAGRGDAALDDLIGMFVNTLVFRTRVDPAASFTELLARQRDTDIQAYAHADVPFERLVEVLNPVRSTARHPLFQVGLSFQNHATSTLELPGLTVSAVGIDAELSQFDLHFIIGDRYTETGAPDGIIGHVTYATALFDADTVAGFVQRFERVLTEILTAPATPVGALDLLAPAERERILLGWNDTGHEVESGTTLADLLDRTVAASPFTLALVADEPRGRVELSYRELADEVNQLARHLISLGVGPESRVVLALRRSADLVVAMYAVTVAGGAYVPVDPDQPADRTDYILETAAPVCVLTNSEAGFTTTAAPVVDIDALELDSLAAETVTDAERVAPLRPEHTAYVIFTSGSTGRPKGVAVPNRAIVNQMLWKTAEFGLGSDDAVLLKTAATFDLSVWEFWSAAVSGGCLIVAAPDGHRDPLYLNELMAREQVTTLHTVPSMLDALMTESGGALTDSMRRVLAIGEALPASVAQRFRSANPHATLFNLYGPTEAAVSITAHTVTDADQSSVSIGAPEWNSHVYVLDSRLQPVPVGVPGELYLAGAQLARGYFGRPDLTADRFVANPFATGERMYRTGDLVAWTAAGELDYRGRTDFQVKIRGFRIELGEIEAALLAMPEIAQAAVVAKSDPHTGDRLVAYLVGALGQSAPGAQGGQAQHPAAASVLDPVTVKSALAATLPSYMVPSAFVVLDALPLNANGKLDRKALPNPEFEPTTFREPATDLERTVARIFAETLGKAQIGADDDFFTLGGNSLLATQVASRLRTVTGVEVRVAWFFTAPTVAALSAQILTVLEGEHAYDTDSDAGLQVLLPIRATGTRIPIFCAPPMAGMSWTYAGLARFLPEDQPIYGLQSPAMTEPDYDPSSITEVARRYVAEMRAVQPEGPYRVLGYSLGGILAYAIATELQSDGQEVDLVAILDSYPESKSDFRTSVLDEFAAIGVGPEAFPDGDLLELSEEALTALHAAVPAGLAVLTLDRMRRIYRGAVRSLQLESAYHPAPFHGRIDLFRAEFRSPGEPQPHSAADWEPFVTGEITQVTYPFAHQVLTTPEALAEIGPRLAELVAQADIRRTTPEPVTAHSAQTAESEPVSARPATVAPVTEFASTASASHPLRPEPAVPGFPSAADELPSGPSEPESYRQQIMAAAGELAAAQPEPGSAPGPAGERTLPELMAAAVAADPDAPAMLFRGRTFTYGQLDAESSRLARVLIDHGAGPRVRVAVALPRSVASVLATWAVAKTGAAFVPVNAAHHTARLERALTESRATLGLTISAETPALPRLAHNTDWLALDDPAFGADVESRPPTPISDAELPIRIRPANVAYVHEDITATQAQLTDLATTYPDAQLRVDKSTHEILRALATATPVDLDHPAPPVAPPPVDSFTDDAAWATTAVLPAITIDRDGPSVKLRAPADDEGLESGSDAGESTARPGADGRTVDRNSGLVPTISTPQRPAPQPAAAEFDSAVAGTGAAAERGFDPDAAHSSHFATDRRDSSPSAEDDFASGTVDSGLTGVRRAGGAAGSAVGDTEAAIDQTDSTTLGTHAAVDSSAAEIDAAPDESAAVAADGSSAANRAPAEDRRAADSAPAADERAAAPAPAGHAPAANPAAAEHAPAAAAAPVERVSSADTADSGAGAAASREGVRVPAGLGAALAAAAPRLTAVGQVSPLPAGAVSVLEVDSSGVWERAITLDIGADCSGSRVRRSVAGLLERHPALWARLRWDEDSAVLDIPARPDRGAAVVWQLDPGVQAVGDPIQAVINAAAVELDPENGRNIRFVLVENRDAEPAEDPADRPAAVLVVVANGLVVDDTSWRTIIEDLTASWSGGHATPPSADAHPSGIARALAERASGPDTVHELSWWREALAGASAGASPDELSGDPELAGRGRVSVSITGEGAAAVDTVARHYDASIDDVLLGALAVALLDESGESARRTTGSVVRLVADGRDEGSRTVGAFSTTYPFPLRLDGVDFAEVRRGGPSAGAVLEQIRDQARRVPSQGVGFGLLQHLNPATAADIAGLPVGRIGFRYRDLRPARVYPEPVADDLYLDVTVDTTQDGLMARFDFAGAALDLEQVKALVEGWVQALGGLAEHGRAANP